MATFAVYSSQSDHAYLYSNGQSQEIYPTPFMNTESGALGINDNGQIATSYQGKAYIYDTRTNTRTGLGPNDNGSIARAINQNGVITGYSNSIGGYIFDPRVGVAQVLPTTANEIGKPSAYAINSHNDVVGYGGFGTSLLNSTDHAYLYHNSVAQDLGTLPGGFNSSASGINDSGDIVGSSDGTGISDTHAFLYHNGKMQDLGTLYPSDPYSVANGINNEGDIIGNSGNYPFVYQNGAMLNLRSMIDPNDGWILEDALAINDRGQIAGYGIYNGIQTGFLLTPTASAAPESGSLLTLSVGLGVMLLAVRRRKQMNGR